MGLLDDAIRDHLDLKRRRGADPADVERAEREALGPVRRGVEPVEEAGHPTDESTGEPLWDGPPGDSQAVSGSGAPGPLTFEHEEPSAPPEPPPREPEAPVTAPSLRAVPPPAEPRPAAPPPTEPLPTEPPPVEPPPAAAAPLESPPAPAPEPYAAPAPPPADGHVAPDSPSDDGVVGGGETVEYDVERALESEPAPREGEEDVLEETPEFLQDTPDHDRLWFEQRPPRDFDFDG
jgi:hypothetical protein